MSSDRRRSVRNTLTPKENACRVADERRTGAPYLAEAAWSMTMLSRKMLPPSQSLTRLARSCTFLVISPFRSPRHALPRAVPQRARVSTRTGDISWSICSENPRSRDQNATIPATLAAKALLSRSWYARLASRMRPWTMCRSSASRTP